MKSMSYLVMKSLNLNYLNILIKIDHKNKNVIIIYFVKNY